MLGLCKLTEDRQDIICGWCHSTDAACNPPWSSKHLGATNISDTLLCNQQNDQHGLMSTASTRHGSYRAKLCKRCQRLQRDSGNHIHRQSTHLGLMGKEETQSIATYRLLQVMLSPAEHSFTTDHQQQTEQWFPLRDTASLSRNTAPHLIKHHKLCNHSLLKTMLP